MVARLVFLTGSKAGTTVELGEADVTIGRKPDRTIAFSTDDVLVSTEHATVRNRQGRYILRDDGSRNGTFVNSTRITERTLEHGDVIQLGPGGPSLRFVSETKQGTAVTVDIVAQTERRAAEVAATSPAGAPVLTTRDLVAVTYHRLTQRIRGTAIAVLALVVVAIAGLVVWQWSGQARTRRALDDLASQVTATRAATEQNMADVAARLSIIADAIAPGDRRVARTGGGDGGVLGPYSRGVVLLTVAYGFIDGKTGELLRYELDQGQFVTRPGPGGRPVPRVTVGGSGPPFRLEATGTGFVIDSTGYLITSRRIAEPWARDGQLDRLRAQGMDVTARIFELRAHLPPGDQSFPVIVHRLSQDADVAVLRVVGRPRVPFLPVAADTVLVRPGDRVMLIGYPTDIRGLLARSDTTERNDILRRAGNSGERLLEELKRRQLIRPMVVEGAVTSTTASEVVNNAGAEIGVSGGPLIDARNRVVAVQHADSSASTPRGVRIQYAWALIPQYVKNRIRP